MRGITIAAVHVGRRLLHPLCRLAEHPVQQPADHAHLADETHRLLTREGAGIELARHPFGDGSHSGEVIEHLFASYRRPTTLTRGSGNDSGHSALATDARSAASRA